MGFRHMHVFDVYMSMHRVVNSSTNDSCTSVWVSVNTHIAHASHTHRTCTQVQHAPAEVARSWTTVTCSRPTLLETAVVETPLQALYQAIRADKGSTHSAGGSAHVYTHTTNKYACAAPASTHITRVNTLMHSSIQTRTQPYIKPLHQHTQDFTAIVQLVTSTRR